MDNVRALSVIWDACAVLKGTLDSDKDILLHGQLSLHMPWYATDGGCGGDSRIGGCY